MECTRKICFDAAHRVIGHESKCKNLHGHRYSLEITAKCKNLNDLGMVVDFGELKEIMKGWIDANFDHNIILSHEDRAMGDVIANHTGQRIYYIDSNPTAENILLYLKNVVVAKLFKNKTYEIARMRLYETPNAYVEVIADE